MVVVDNVVVVDDVVLVELGELVVVCALAFVVTQTVAVAIPAYAITTLLICTPPRFLVKTSR